MAKMVIVFGGNALGKNPEEQQTLIQNAVENLVPLIKEGHQILLGHGNGPQVGIINLAFEDSYENKDIPYMPFPECTAMSQGYIGFHMEKALRTILEKHHIKKNVVTLVTEVVVDQEDGSFKIPSKPVGPFYTEEVAHTLMKQTGEQYIEDAGRGYRKVVASPKPLHIVQMDTIKELLSTDHIVIAGGGGGIPIYKQNPDRGASAVVDKDSLAALMAKEWKADFLIILTNVNQAELFYGTDHSEKIGKISVQEAEQYIKDKQFAKGSMLPKIEAATDFVKNRGGRSIITSLACLGTVLSSNNVTEIYKK